MDGVTQANYALSYMANIGVQRQAWPERQPPVGDSQQKGVGAVETQQTGIGMPVRPEDAGAKIMRSVDGDTISISAEGQAYVRQASAPADTPDMTSATARVEGADDARVQAAGDARTVDRPAQTRFDLPQGGGIERADFEQPQVQQIQDEAVEAQEAERTDPQLQLQDQQEPASAVEEVPEEEAAEEKVDPSDFRQYFNSELRQMLYRGQITQQQYDKEIESRQTENDLKIDKKMI